MKVQDAMTKTPITICPEDTVEEAIACIEKFRIRALPVVSNGRLVGIVTRYDIRKKSKSRKQKISEIMTKNVLKISPDEEVYVGLQTLKRTRTSTLLVAKGNELLGVLTKNMIFIKNLYLRMVASSALFVIQNIMNPKKSVQMLEHPCNKKRVIVT